MTSTLPPLVQALSGAVGSASASTLTYPLDLITTRLQLDSSVKAKRRGGVKGGLRLLLFIVYGSERKGKPGFGWRALYDGLQSDLFATILSNFFYFYFYSFLRSTLTHGMSSSISLPALKHILGTQSTSGKLTGKPHKPSLFEDLVLGFVAGVASRAISTPLNIITLRLQEERADAEGDDLDSSDGELSDDGAPPPTEKQTMGNSPAGENGLSSPGTISRKEDMGILDVARLIHKEDGLQGFWKGFMTSALLSINPSITLAFFQLFRKVVVYSKRRSGSGHVSPNLKPMEAFFVGAIANSIASTILYPLILAKKRLQSGAGIAPNATLLDVLKDAYLGQYDPHGSSPFAATTTATTPLSRSNYQHHSAPTRPPTKRSKSSRYRSEAWGKTEGAEGLYQGLQMQILKGFLNQGVTFLVKGRIEQFTVDENRQANSARTFLQFCANFPCVCSSAGRPAVRAEANASCDEILAHPL